MILLKNIVQNACIFALDSCLLEAKLRNLLQK